MQPIDRQMLERASWHLASDLVRRYPHRLTLLRGHPAGGQADVLWVLPQPGERGDLRLNREGTIRVIERFDGRLTDIPPIEWYEYFEQADEGHSAFVDQLADAAGLPSVTGPACATSLSLTYRVLAEAIEQLSGVEALQCALEPSGYFLSGRDELHGFDIPADLLSPRSDDRFGDPGYRFWLVAKKRSPLFLVEQSSATLWVNHSSDPFDLVTLYRHTHHRIDVMVTALLSEIGLRP